MTGSIITSTGRGARRYPAAATVRKDLLLHLPRAPRPSIARGHQPKDAARLDGWANNGDTASIGSPRGFSL
jgi:hypothetical protein